MAPPRDAEPSGQLTKYRRIAAVGQGGMADVWLVVAQGPGGFSKLLALKELKPELCGDPEFVAMFLAEARLAARLNHPNVVQTYEVGLEGERPYIVMEWLEGQPLHALLGPHARAPMPLGAQVLVLAQALEGLDYAHDLCDFDGTPLNLVHRDVSPHNVFVGYDGSVKLMDFGIAKISGGAQTQASIVKGKVGYVAPEQIVGAPVDRRADVFAVGVMLWEALVGRRLSAGEARNAAFARRIRGEYEPVLRLAPDAPPALAAAAERAMARSPDDRPPTAAALRADLEAWLDGQHTSERDVAALVAAAFAEERRHVRKLVERQMRALQDERPSAPGGVPIVALAPAGGPGGRGSGRSHERGPAPTLLTMGPPPLDAGAVTLPMTQAMSVEAAAWPAAPPRRGRAGLALGAAAAAIALGALALRAPWHKPPPAPRATEAAALGPTPGLPLGGAVAAPPAPSAEPASPRPETELTVRSQPPGAWVYLDDAPIGQSPLTYRAPRDGRPHTLRVSAPGFRDEERTIALGRDHAVEVLLKHQGRPGRGAPRGPSAPAAAAEGGAEPDRLKQPGRDARPIEESNPY